MVFGFWRRADSAKALSQAPTLSEGAATVYRTAKERKLPLAYVAERHSQGPQYWFADSLLRQGAVYGRRPGDPGYTLLSREHLVGLALAADLAGLRNGASSEPQVTDLRTPEAELRRYVRWARTVQ